MNLTATDIRDIALTALATTAAAFITPAFPFLGLPLAALALGWLTYRVGTAAGVGVALGASAAVTALIAWAAPGSLGSALFVVVAMLACGPFAARALVRWKVTSVIAAVTVLTFAALVAAASIEAAAQGVTVLAQVREQAQQAYEVALRMATTPGAAATLRSESAVTIATIVMLWPSGLFVSVALSAALAVPVVSWVGSRLGAGSSRLPAMADLDLSFHLVWLAIAGIGLVAAGTFVKQPTGLLSAIGGNLLVIVRPALFVQGLAVFASLYRRLGVGRFGRGFGFMVLGFMEVVLPTVSVVGIVDLFFNWRKLPRADGGQAAGTA